MGHDIRPTGSLHHKWSNTASSTSDMFLLWWSFNEFGTIGRGDCHNYLDVTSFSRTFNDFTSKLFDGFLFMKYEEFYQDIYNNNISMDTISSFCQRDIFCQWEKRVKLNCLEE